MSGTLSSSFIALFTSFDGILFTRSEMDDLKRNLKWYGGSNDGVYNPRAKITNGLPLPINIRVLTSRVSTCSMRIE